MFNISFGNETKALRFTYTKARDITMGLYDIQLYELLKARLGENGADDVVRQLRHQPNENLFDPKNLVANKEDIAMLKEDIANARIEVLRWMLAFFVALTLAVLGLYL